MGWINVRWGVPQIIDDLISLSHEATLALDKVVEQIHVSLLLAQLTIEGAPTMLCLEALFDFVAIG
jgi:hypothetical protein